MRGSVLLTCLAVTAALSVSCSDSGPSDPSPVQGMLVFTRADNSRLSFAKGAAVSVWCAPWEEGVVATPSLQILFGQKADEPHWWLHAAVADVTIGQALAFPNNFVWDQPKGVDIFVGDPVGPNELSTQAGGSGGSITFQQLDCGNGGGVEFTIDAVIGSEFGNGPSIGVSGDFRAPVGGPPSF